MMIWDMAMIWNVRRSFVAVDLPLQDPRHRLGVERAGEVLIEYVKEKFGVTLHMVDLADEVTEVDHFRMIQKLRVTWHPSTHVVEFCGGPRDGELMVVDAKLLFQDIYLPALAVSPTFALSGDLSALVPVQHLSYRHTGWHEEQRRWIYTYQNQK